MCTSPQKRVPDGGKPIILHRMIGKKKPPQIVHVQKYPNQNILCAFAVDIIKKHRFDTRQHQHAGYATTACWPCPHGMLHLLLALAMAQASPLAAARQLQALAVGRLPPVRTQSVTALSQECRSQAGQAQYPASLVTALRQCNLW